MQKRLPVQIYSSQRYEKLTTKFKTKERKQNTFKKNKNQKLFVLRSCFKKPLLSCMSIKDNEVLGRIW